MRIVAVIQARMGSSRLPGKILMPLAGKPVLRHVIERVQMASVFDEIAVATTNRDIDDEAARLAALWGATVIRGDEDDVLSRFGVAAEMTNADAVMRITADCPLIDPETLAAMVGQYQHGDFALITNARHRTFPRGLDAELFSRSALEIMLKEARDVSQREHVTPFLYAHPHRFAIFDWTSQSDHSELRLTLDTPEDYELLNHIFDSASDTRSLRLSSVLAILEANPEWRNINFHIEQKKV